MAEERIKERIKEDMLLLLRRYLKNDDFFTKNMLRPVPLNKIIDLACEKLAEMAYEAVPPGV